MKSNRVSIKRMLMRLTIILAIDISKTVLRT